MTAPKTRRARKAADDSGARGDGKRSRGDEPLVAMTVVELTVDPWSEMPVVMLVAEEGGERVPIGIGVGDAPAIASAISNVELQRPTCHDLLKRVLLGSGARVLCVEIHDLRDDVFYASIIIERAAERGREVVALDARPSDALALALRTSSPIQVAPKVIRGARDLNLRQRRRGAELHGKKKLRALDGPDDDSFGDLPDLADTRELLDTVAGLDPIDDLDGIIDPAGPLDPLSLEDLHGSVMEDPDFPPLESIPDEDFGKWKM